MRIQFILLITTLAILTSSCVVGKKKYEQEVANRKLYETKSQNLDKELKTNKETLEKTTQELSSQKAEVAKLSKQITDLDKQIASLKAEKEKALADNVNLKNQLDEVTDQALSQREKMDAALQAKLLELERKEKIIDDLQASVALREKAMNDILGKIQRAIEQYKSSDLSVEMRDGKVYIALSNELLFKSGSASVDPKGKDALGTLAAVLEKNPDIHIMVEGHTDNVPISSSATFKDNWDLSVIRATSVVRLLTKDFKLNPNQVSASGKGEFAPKADNSTAEGRAVNRRIEIIIQPKLDEIYNLVKKG